MSYSNRLRSSLFDPKCSQQRLRLGNLGHWRSRRETFERWRENGMGVDGTAGRLVELSERKRGAQLEAPRTLLFCDSDGGQKSFFRRRTVGGIALQQDIAASIQLTTAEESIRRAARFAMVASGDHDILPSLPLIGGRRRIAGLLIITDAAAKIFVSPGYEAYLRNGRIIGARLWQHIADLGDLTFRLLNRRVHFRAKRLAPRVLSGAHVCAKGFLEFGIANRNDCAVASICTKHVEISIPKSAFSLVEHVERFGLIRSHSGNRFHQHGLGFFGRTAGLLTERRGESAMTAAGAAAIMNLRTIAFLLSRAPRKGAVHANIKPSVPLTPRI
jgi:hypothetical protein